MAEVKLVLVPGHKPIRILKWLVKKGDWIKHGTSLAIYRIVEDPSKPNKSKEMHLKSKHVGTLKMFLLQEGQVAIPGGILLEIDGCSHPVVMKDLCAECGQDLRASAHHSKKKRGLSHSASVSMIPSIPELRISTEQAEELGEQDKNRLLKMRKLVLLVDLDQTLIHTTQDPGLAALCQSDEDFYTFQLSKNDPVLYTKLRPHCREFLKEVSKRYELQIVTFGSRQYAHKIADFIDPEKKHFAHRILSRDECIHPFKKSGNLKHLFPCGDSMVCIIDDRDDVWNAVPNLIVVKKYTYFQGTEDINDPNKRRINNRDQKQMQPVEKASNRRKRECDDTGNEDQNKEQNNVKRCRIERQDNVDIKSEANETDTNAEAKETTETTEGMVEDQSAEKEVKVPPDKNGVDSEVVEDKEEKEENGLKKEPSVDEDLSLSSDSESDSGSSTSSSSSSDSKSSNSSSESEMPSQKSSTKKVDGEGESRPAKEGNLNGTKDKSSQDDTVKEKEKPMADVQMNECNNNNEIEKTKIADAHIEKMDQDVITENKSELPKEGEVCSQDTCTISSQSSAEKASSQTSLARETSGFSAENNEFSAYSECSSQESADNTQQKYKDSDDYLPYLQDVLLQIHGTYYEAYDKYLNKEFKDLPDVRGVVPFLRSKVLYGCCIVLTGVIPHNFRLPPHQHKAFIVARQLGAEVHEQITDRTTHLIAAKKGTAKYQEAKKQEKQNIRLVSVDWLWCCSERWERVPEKLFPVPDKMASDSSSREGTPPVVTTRPELGPEEITNTYDPVTGKLMKKVRDARFNFMVAEESWRREEKAQPPIVYSSLQVPDAVVPVIPARKVNTERSKSTPSNTKHMALTKSNTTPGTSGSSVPAPKKRDRKRSMVEMVGIEYSLSTDDIADMDKEVNDLLESSDEEQEELGTLIENPVSSVPEPSQETLEEVEARQKRELEKENSDDDDDNDEDERESGEDFDEMAALLDAEMHYTDDDDEVEDSVD